jgi:DNA-binding transcriptional ArsR family regulator
MNKPAKEPAASAPRRQLTDAQELRALAHPVRVELLELLGREGPLTATQAGDLLGESPANMSFHLRTLAKHGFVEEAQGGTGRQRPWRRVAVAHSFELDSEEADTSAVAHALSHQFAVRSMRRREVWEATQASYPKEWRDASYVFDSVTYLTAEELRTVGEEIMAIIDRYSARVADRDLRPGDAYPVALVSTGHPLAPTPSGN